MCIRISVLATSLLHLLGGTVRKPRGALYRLGSRLLEVGRGLRPCCESIVRTPRRGLVVRQWCTFPIRLMLIASFLGQLRIVTQPSGFASTTSDSQSEDRVKDSDKSNPQSRATPDPAPKPQSSPTAVPATESDAPSAFWLRSSSRVRIRSANLNSLRPAYPAPSLPHSKGSG